ncbi:hypothetical protein LZG74_22715 [Dyadobacter sp. CY327]|uniref:hypothetical protein n=1 Tax=Dyadobacter sp. CY327 TaxID=2907301 RepID=UPI001F490B38|nr:hypothetical protein [Dyadobacter sp. CY327]MCE7073147.1 hypothetical protein [Dyadobacter sp. CY327]
MKTQLLKSVSSCLVFSAVLFVSACNEEQILQEGAMEKQELSDDANAKLIIGQPTKFNAFTFAEEIERYMEDQKVGFGYSIMSNGEEFFVGNGGEGFARKAFEAGGEKQHGALVQQESLQATQYVTALAVFKILKRYNLSLQTKVWPYLPKGWEPSTGFKSLNFEQLLSHRTGLVNGGTEQSIMVSVKGEVNTSLRQPNDINYILLGIITPYVDAVEKSKKGNSTLLKVLNQAPSNFNIYAAEFRKIVYENVFLPAGIKQASLIDWQAWGDGGYMEPHLSTQGYLEIKGTAAGVDKAVVSANAGATGLYMSASQFANLQSAVSQLKVISAADLHLMKDKLFGFDGALNGTIGKYYYKTGLGYRCNTIIMDFGKAQVALFTNSPISVTINHPVEIAKRFEKSLEK